jgi:hypothetical protein
MGATSGHLGAERLVQPRGGRFVHQARVGVGQFEDARHGQKVFRHVGPGGILQHRHQLQDGVRADLGAGVDMGATPPSRPPGPPSRICWMPPPQALTEPASRRGRPRAVGHLERRPSALARAFLRRDVLRDCQSSICALAMVRVRSKLKTTFSFDCGPQ